MYFPSLIGTLACQKEFCYQTVQRECRKKSNHGVNIHLYFVIS